LRLISRKLKRPGIQDPLFVCRVAKGEIEWEVWIAAFAAMTPKEALASCCENKIFPVDGSVTLEGLKVNIQVQFRDGVLKEPLPGPERYADESYVRQAQKELGL
ncbi:MAG: hypothetical protein ACREQV_10225, partial [Candidatus Binatia bacterium]